MNCTDAQLKAQAIIDNELDESEIEEVITHMETCYTCRSEYINLLKLQRKIGNVCFPEPPKEWFEDLSKNSVRRTGTIIGRISFFGSYLFLFVFFLYQYFSDQSKSLFVKYGIAVAVLGGLVLFGITLFDRFKESKTDRYSEVEK